MVGASSNSKKTLEEKDTSDATTERKARDILVEIDGL
jgi:hypothetical protein